MSTVREAHVETPSAYHNVADLEWLIGTWTAEEHGGTMTSVCRWVANKSFVERSFIYVLERPHNGDRDGGYNLLWDDLTAKPAWDAVSTLLRP